MKKKHDIKEDFPLRYIARFKVTAACPLGIGSGQAGTLVDRLVARDAVGLPYIPGSSLAGVIRHELKKQSDFLNEIDTLFGFQEEPNDNEEPAKGQGSRIHFGSGLLVADDFQTVHEGLSLPNFEEDYYDALQAQRLPERDHVKITHRGVAAEHAKYEEEYVPKGACFVFQIELLAKETDKTIWKHILNTLHQPTFRIGAGTRKGFGQLKVESCQVATYDLTKQEQLKDYLLLGSSYNAKIDSYWTAYQQSKVADDNWLPYTISLKAKDFFQFGAGIGDEEVNHAPKTEHFIHWKNGKPQVAEKQYLIPATSLKGALSHRVAYHYNCKMGHTIENIQSNYLGEFATQFDTKKASHEIDFGLRAADLDWPADDPRWEDLIYKINQQRCEQSKAWKDFERAVEEAAKVQLTEVVENYVGENNTAVKKLFGYAKDSKAMDGARGKVIFSDFYLSPDEVTTKIFNHVKIDRFTGGGIDGALFQEKVITTDEIIIIKLYVEKDVFIVDKEKIRKNKNLTEKEIQEEIKKRKVELQCIKEAFEKTIEDLKKGKIPLGGSTAKGHGIFTEVLATTSPI